MRIVVITDWFSENMGYAENCLPKAMAALGQEVHVVASNAQVYYGSPSYKETYEPFIGPEVVSCQVKALDGFTLHRLPYGVWHGVWDGLLRIRGLMQQLVALRPQVVQTFHASSPTTYEAALVKVRLNCKLFTGNHVVASVFPLYRTYDEIGWRKRLIWNLTRRLPGRVVDSLSEKCYAVTTDAAEIAVRFFGVAQRKSEVSPLGVDTDLFHPVCDAESTEDRQQLRRELGFADEDIVCIYTGRFSSDKNPLVLARAIERLAAHGERFRGLFVGGGPPENAAAIRACAGCVIHRFVPFVDLPRFYRSADVGVWPKQESTSMLDASAVGLPIVVSDRVHAVDHLEGNGLTCQEGDAEDLARVLLALKDPSQRAQLGARGAAKIVSRFSWRSIAERRLADYLTALGNREE